MSFPDSDDSSGFNRRQHVRKIVRRTAHLQFPDRSVIKVRTTDISKGGVGVIADLNLLHGTVCILRFTIPLHSQDKTILNVQAKVTHSVFSHAEKGFKIGFQFTDLDSGAEETIARFLVL
jgi:c-di-GMP-binding flagellar brake protein YcgR